MPQEKARLQSSFTSMQHHVVTLEAKLKESAVEVVQLLSAVDSKQHMVDSLQVGGVFFVLAGLRTCAPVHEYEKFIPHRLFIKKIS